MRPHIWRWLSTILASFLLFSCSAHDRTAVAVPELRADRFHPIGMPPSIRTYGDEYALNTDRLIADYRATFLRFPKSKGLNILALSGGGPDGAFGAGVLAGWSQNGRRPEFDIVTGISTGAIIAPFAFLGAEYDENLRRFYTQTQTRQIVRFRVLRAVIDGGFIADTAPLAAAIERELTDEVIAAIARKAESGADLLIGTTNIDAERPVVWDIGELAQLGTPKANDLIRQVILASASVPIVFKPVPIEVSDGTEIREELHVDGGLTNEIFVYPREVPMRRILRETGFAARRNTIWLIQNKSIWPDYEPQNTRLPQLVERTVNLLVKSQTLGDIVQISALAKRDGFHVNGLVIPPEFDEEQTQLFDPVYMSKLYNLGFRHGADPNSWYTDLEELLE